ncbi:HAD-IIIA family hydrolase [Isoptericola sp. S6320L]|uniref:HAD-IIIA family hydrolase n=1 Tax=Isoptericola sp. S6320L TaxID=2926411 RepID=UPI0027E2B3AA|nr:HAD-IIIA family hydrolase [Isoptericola sp. S6320L]
MTANTPETSHPTLDTWAVVVPTVGRPSLRLLLDSLVATLPLGSGSEPSPLPEVVVVDDRPVPASPQPAEVPPPLDLGQAGARLHTEVVRTGGRGPAAARNAGWRSTRATWVVFLDDDVEAPRHWAAGLASDLAAAGPGVGGVQGNLDVPLPESRRPTDAERNTAALEGAAWATADMAYRRRALEDVGGFDERFPRAYREDADLALRVRDAGWRLVRGVRRTTHPPRPSDGAASLRAQVGARDDALMRALHGRRWRERAATGSGRLPWHVATVGAAALAVTAAAAGRRRTAAVGAGVWAGLTADFLARRLVPGPRPGDRGFGTEVWRMAWTSVAIPFAAVSNRAAGSLARRGGVEPWPPPISAVLLDRDGTLVHDVPYNGDPTRVEPLEDVLDQLDVLRARGVRLGVVSNQSGVARGVLTRAQVQAVNDHVEKLLGPFDTWQVCVHAPQDGCWCRKPAPGLVHAAATALGVEPWRCAVVGDIGSDVAAGIAAGAETVLVPTAVTRRDEVDDAPVVAPDLAAAVRYLEPRLSTSGTSRRTSAGQEGAR